MEQLSNWERLYSIDEVIRIELYREGNLAYLQASLLTTSGLADHAFSTRLGGCSTGVMSTLNTAFHTGDSEANVLENRSRFFSLFDYDYLDLIAPIQVHGTGLTVANEVQRGEGALPGSARISCDGMIATQPGLILTAYAADCLLIYLVARNKPLVALAHAGWRGTLGGMAGGLVNYLQSLFGIEPQHVLTALSPAICKKCYQVSTDVAELFAGAGWNSSSYLEKGENGKWQLDLTAINKAQLLKAGVKETNLSLGKWCSSCDQELFYSYRRDNGVTGRMVGFISLK